MMVQRNVAISVNTLFTSLLRQIMRLLCLVFILLGVSFSVFAAQQNELKGVRTWPSPDNTRIVLDLSQKPHYQVHYLAKPDRLVIDLSTTHNKANLKAIQNKGKVVKNIRESASGQKNTFRLVVDLKQPSTANIFSLAPAKPYGHRLVIDLPSIKTNVPTSIAAIPNGRDIIIAIDAGHGGDDPGALGKYSYEKKVTLQIAKRLKNQIDAQKGMQAFLIRTGDYFVNLNKRSDIARKGKADFLVSIHADGFTSSRPRGASVWVLSNRRATTELGRWMEKNEAHSELLGGAGNIIQDSDSVPFLNKMLLDMSMGNTMGVGYTIGDLVTNELSKVTTMHKKKPVHASLAVLKSPDIPSILVEAGFITNRTEERLLNQADFQHKIANAVYKGIYNHFSHNPPQGSLFAQKKRAIKHTVRSGESLSVVARRYSVSSQELKEFNHLTSNSLRIGQELSIPSNYQVVVKADPNKAPILAKSTSSTNLVQLPTQEHIVARGESLSVIAFKYSKTTEQLVAYNQLRKTSLAVGQKIKIPGDYVEAAAVISKPAAQVLVQKEQLHKVQRGESLSVIANRYNKSLALLMSYNKLKKSSLAVGQKIKIPGTDIESSPVATSQIVSIEAVHEVKRGESLSVIANKYNKSTAELKSYNQLQRTSLAIGQKLKIPGIEQHSIEQYSSKQPLVQVVHIVARGESLSVIASQYNTTVANLKSDNQLRSTSLRVGQKIKVPALTRSNVIVKASNPTFHKVKSGESLSVIAQRYGRTSKQFEVYNHLRSSKLLVGQTLKIPSDDYQLPVIPSSHIVKSGQSLSVIAQKYDSSIKQLKLFNNLHSSRLFVGQKLKIPAQKVEKTEHKVRSGESLSVIAQRYGTTTSAIISSNNLRSNSLAVGQVLTIPIS